MRKNNWIVAAIAAVACGVLPVSYTHLDVYKRQVSAHVGLKCNVVRDPKRPLKATEDAGNFKLYESDTGMLASRYDISVARGLYSDDRTLNLGFRFENVFAQALTACGCDLFYYMNRKRGEVDFPVSYTHLDVYKRQALWK